MYDPTSATVPARPQPPPAPIAIPSLRLDVNAVMRALVDELAAEGLPSPLHQPFTLGCVWADLCRLAGEDVPAEVAALLGETVA